MMNGITAFDIEDIFSPVTLEAAAKFIPTGGVTCPIARLTVIIIPKCKGSIPTDFITGRKIGRKI